MSAFRTHYQVEREADEKAIWKNRIKYEWVFQERKEREVCAKTLEAQLQSRDQQSINQL